eukprot:9156714-Alexandrium_andersonii.AAC.1
MLRSFEPDDGPERQDLPRALRRRTDSIYDASDPGFEPSDQGDPTLGRFFRVARAPPATITQP